MDLPDAFSDAKRIVKQVYDQVYTEFRVWKAEYASRIMDSLVQPPSYSPAQMDDTVTQEPPFDLPEDSPEFPEFFPTSSYQISIESYDYKTGLTEQIPFEVTRVHDLPPRAPEHEHCTPSNRNVFVGDDPQAMPFMPFLNDPTFDHDAYADEHKTYAWEPELTVDPDVDAVVIETTRRLLGEHHMCYELIDETEILPYELLDHNGARGVYRGAVYRSHRRDYLPWPPGIPDSAKPLPQTQVVPGATPTEKLTNLVSHFCTNLNCIVGYCNVHLDPMPMPLPVLPRIPNDRMAKQTDHPCGDQCFLSVDAPEPETIRWSQEDFQFLEMFMTLDPDTIPCDLATLCRRPCFEAFYQRGVILASTPIPPANNRPNGKRSKSSRPKFADHDSAKFTPGGPCGHEGPCDSTSQCACYLNKAHCERWCRCDKKCVRRWKGCQCRVLHKRCRTDSCSCFKAHRECDPELCIPCSAKYAEANICQNANIQREKWKRTQVGPSRWGRGLFMAEDTEADELIIEYIGEIIFDPTTESREHITKHRGRNYLFQLNETTSVDGVYLANDARFINHNGENPNCKAGVKLVNGEHRIGLYSTRRIKSGEEILFNYGKHFFQEREAEVGPGIGKGKGKAAESNATDTSGLGYLIPRPASPPSKPQVARKRALQPQVKPRAAKSRTQLPVGLLPSSKQGSSASQPVAVRRK
ncbi:hypothetical protein FB45DRAFT_920000 [Roridomyces roridus]|uniref:SET domain-containing protein n=1 Tax=Roridomyces roridus TaxID=1738132 RepID=A0AAD7BSS2_9AGAR|nr:hypothetical protein FB45DRAFT_920000 [Roridomyces roridus]